MKKDQPRHEPLDGDFFAMNEEIYPKDKPDSYRLLHAFERLETAAGGLLPLAKRALDLRLMAPFISQVWMVERLQQDKFKIRLWSTESTTLFGRDNTGRIVTDGSPTYKWFTFYNHTLKTGEPLVVENQVTEHKTQVMLSEAILWPLTDPSGTPLFVLGVWDVLDRGPHSEPL